MSVKVTFVGAGSVVFSKQLMMDILSTLSLRIHRFPFTILIRKDSKLPN